MTSTNHNGDAVQFRIGLLADAPAAIPGVAHLRWQEWGHGDEPSDPQVWLEISAREAGRESLPVTFVALDDEQVLGAVGLDHFDIDERHDVTPWITGTIVAPQARRRGVAGALMCAIEKWAVDHGIDQAWVATERASDFYRSCGWSYLETIERPGDDVDVLHKSFV